MWGQDVSLLSSSLWLSASYHATLNPRPTTLHFPETSKRRGWFFFVPQVTPFLHPSFQLEIPTPDFLFLPFSAAKREKEKLLILITEERHVTSFQKEPVDFPFRFCSQWLPGKKEMWKNADLTPKFGAFPSFLPCLLPSSLFVESRGKGGKGENIFERFSSFFAFWKKGGGWWQSVRIFFFEREKSRSQRRVMPNFHKDSSFLSQYFFFKKKKRFPLLSHIMTSGRKGEDICRFFSPSFLREIAVSIQTWNVGLPGGQR